MVLQRWLNRLVVLAPLAAFACADIISSTKPDDVETMQARWNDRGIVSYRYDYDQGGFFNGCTRPLRVYVHAGVVDSATVLSTGQPVPASQLPCAATLVGLFQSAVGAAHAGDLTTIRYDPVYGYPTEIDIAGPPDASGWLSATNLRLLPLSSP